MHAINPAHDAATVERKEPWGQFNRYVALAGGYFNLGKFGFIADTLPPGTLNGRIKLQGINFDLLGALPLTARISAIARIGALYTEARDTFQGTGAEDSLFTFDRSSVRPEGKSALDKFAQELRGTTYQVITVEGYTDRLGSDADNQQLSQQRADAVKSYLVTSGGIDAGKISAVGKGPAEPVTKHEECPGAKRSAHLIACLQPDRRVEIEVTGTQ